MRTTGRPARGDAGSAELTLQFPAPRRGADPDGTDHRLHLRSDVPVGAALSGGIDSSSIVACMRKVAPDLEIHAISYIAENPSLSEERWIDVVGGAVNAHHCRAHLKL